MDDHPTFASSLSAQHLLVEERAGRGRCLVATKTFLPGQVIFSQLPYAHVVNEANQLLRCDTCLMAPEGALRRCGHCKVVMYCGQKCQRSAWPIHQHECKAILEARRKHGATPTPTLRLAFRVMTKRYLQEKELLTKDATDSYTRVEALVSHFRDCPQETLVLYAQMASLVKAMADFEGSRISIDSKKVAELLARFACNAHTICDEELKPVCMGLFVVNSLANHDCNPNAIILYDGPNAVMRALHRIEPGDEITHAYTDLAGTANQRRERLRKYFFECHCKRCLNLREDSIEACVAGLRCSRAECKGSPGWNRVLGLRQRNEEDEYVCSCGRVASSDSVDAQEKEAKRISEEAQKAEANGDLAAARRALEKAHKMQEQILHELNWDLVRTRDALVRICMSLEDWRSAAEWCERTLAAYKACLPQPSALYALQLFTLAKLRWFLEEAGACLAVAEKAYGILGITHGQDHRLTREARDLIERARIEASQSLRKPRLH